MSTVAEIKAAIERLSPDARAELEALVWPEWDRPMSAKDADPPQLREKLAAAAKGRFEPGRRENIDRILKSLE